MREEGNEREAGTMRVTGRQNERDRVRENKQVMKSGK